MIRFSKKSLSTTTSPRHLINHINIIANQLRIKLATTKRRDNKEQEVIKSNNISDSESAEMRSLRIQRLAENSHLNTITTPTVRLIKRHCSLISNQYIKSPVLTSLDAPSDSDKMQKQCVAAIFEKDTKFKRKTKLSESVIPLVPMSVAIKSSFNGIALFDSTPAAAAALGVTTTAKLPPLVVTFLKFAPPIAAQVVFLSHLSSMKQFAINGTTGDVSCIPHAAMCANGALWVVYGVLKGDMTIVVPNMSGFFFGAHYVYTFAKFVPPKFSMSQYYGGIAAMIETVLGMAITLETSLALDAIGLTGCAVVAVMFGGPLGSIKTVLRDKNTTSLPVPFTVAAFINCLCWVSYGSLVIDDIYVWGPNLAGLLASTTQLG